MSTHDLAPWQRRSSRWDEAWARVELAQRRYHEACERLTGLESIAPREALDDAAALEAVRLEDLKAARAALEALDAH